MRTVTIKEVAEAANVSIATVSRVLNDRYDVNPETRQKVRDTITRLRYVRNGNAFNLKLKHGSFVGLILKGRRNLFLTSIAEMLLSLAKSSVVKLLIEIIGEEEDEFEALARLRQTRNISCAVFVGSHPSNGSEAISKIDIPCVFTTVDTGFLKLDYVSSVCVDNYACGYKFAEKLISLGHRRIALVGYLGKKEDSVAQRFHGAIDAMKANGINFDERLLSYSNFTLKSGYDAMKRLIDCGEKFTAVLAMSDIVAIGAMKALSDSGLDVPRDVSIVGFDGIEQADYTVPSLSTVVQNVEELAKTSFDLIIAALNGEKAKHICLEGELLMRGSISKPNDNG